LHLPPTKRTFLWSVALLVISLGAIIGLAKVLSPSIESVVRDAGLPLSLVAVIIALVILLPEGVAAVRFSHRGDLQAGFNIGYGSALASIGLTIPALAVFSLVLDVDLTLGLGYKEIVLFILTLVVSTVTVASHRVTLFQGGLHIVIFAAFLFLAVSP
jgi:Ca2+:H+ antiporter